MALCELKSYSETLGMQTSVYVVIPQRSTQGEIGVASRADGEKYKCLYLLHGLSDDYTTWLRRTSIERYAQAYGICVVMPSAVRSFYTDMKYGEKYYTYIARELPVQIREFFRVSDRREDNFVAGLSMGGYGALKIGLRECGRFSAAAGLSAVADIAGRVKSSPERFAPVFGDSLAVPQEEDLFWLARKHSADPMRPRIYMAVGTEDSLYRENVALKNRFDALGYDLTYQEGPGNHDWAFWDIRIQDVLKWLLG